MLIRHISVALVVAHAVHGFKDASPFFLLSTDTLASNSLQSAQVSTAASVEERFLRSVPDCSTSLYIFIQQPGLNAADLRDGSAMPNMRRRMESNEYKSIVQIPEVIGRLDTEDMADRVSRNCGIERADLRDYFASGEQSGSAVLTFDTEPLPATALARKEALQAIDALLEHELSSVLANSTSHVLIQASTPSPAAAEDAEGSVRHQTYKMDEPLAHAAMHTDLKRHVGRIQSRQDDDDDFQAGLPLFEKYQFLTPGIFMGLSVSILLLVILNVGISAIAGLEVSYMAFSKEMGPQAQQKGKQQ